VRLCVVSDSHDRAEPLVEAVRAGLAEGAEAVVHCGDLIGANTLRAAAKLGVPIHLVHGNNLGDAQALHALAREPGSPVRYHGPDARLELGGRRVFVVHYPDYGYAMACTGDWDLVCCGHDHRASVQRVANVKGGATWLVNPGTVAGIAAPATWALGDLDSMRFELRDLASPPRSPRE
jgi:putative phosphoesterase